MSKICFTSDQHFGHKNIIKYCNRPYKTVQEMDDDLINRWNKIVDPQDTVYQLGDLTFSDNETYLHDLFNRLHGKKIILPGNHDPKKAIRIYKEYAYVTRLEELHLPDVPLITLCHYPMMTWNKSGYGSWQLFGHHHGQLSQHGVDPALNIRNTQIDVGVDTNDYYPYTLDDIKKILPLPTILVKD
ncbi:MAG: hypothetical protein ACP5N7_00095 [Candidatus Pacearchaeota archaeon]